jgi:hypothetical protein
MTVLARLERWRTSGAITPEQHDAIAAIVRRDRFSVFVELNILLYIGVLSFIAGVGWSIETYFSNIGDEAIIVTLTVLCGASLYYCFAKSPPYIHGRAESPSLAFDYVLYFGSLVFAVELAYVESRFELLKESWDHYLLLSSILYFVLAYRFDNRFVLSLALSTLAGWFGLRFSRFGILSADVFRMSALLYGVLVAFAGTVICRWGYKPHFLRTYLHLAANVLLAALVSGVASSSEATGIYFIVLLALSGLAIYWSLRLEEFAFAGYGIVYAYIGISIMVLRNSLGMTASLVYLIVSGSAVIVFIAWLASRTGRRA